MPRRTGQLSGVVTIVGGQRFYNLVRNLRRLGPVGINVGILEPHRYPDGTLVAKAALINEYGDPGKNIPERPFMRNSVEEMTERATTILASTRPAFHRVLAARFTGGRISALPPGTAERIGQECKEILQDTITNFSDPPNAPATIRKKGFDDPLIETQRLVEHIDYEVTSGRGTEEDDAGS